MRSLLANKLNTKITMMKDGCRPTPTTCGTPSHTSDSSQSSTTTDTKDLDAQSRDVMDDGKNGEILDDVDSKKYTNTLSNDFSSWGDNYSSVCHSTYGAAYEDFGGWGVTRGLIKNWRWLARLVEKLTHRGLIYYGVYLIVIISGLIMCVTPIADITIKSISEEDYANSLIIWNDISPVDIENDVVWNDISPVDFENDVVRCIRSFSLNNHVAFAASP